MPFNKAIDFIRDNDDFLLSSHVNPDGDGLGSVMGMKWVLSKLGKKSEIVIDSDPPELYDFFDNYHWVKPSGEAGKFSSVITLDAPSIERLGRTADHIASGAQILCIDHHVSNEMFAQVNYIDEHAASTTELVFRLSEALDIEIDKSFAEYIYTGIVIDTGRFRFSNTTPAVLRVSAKLVEAGASPDKIAKRLFYYKTRQTTMALGRFIDSIELHLDGKIATAEFGNDIVSAPEWENVDTEGFVNHPLSIRGVQMVAFLRGVEPNVTRASLRSATDFDVNKLANLFGGGGHAKAAGLTIREPLPKAKQILLDQAKRMIG